ncbi:peptidoglycan-binding protein [Streptomyces echinatus]|uniref:peptidoglycan-binding protein n=1 Tax=Streptomyces echinatus TaxID=67293 RepID=UPI0037BD2DA7
MSLKSTIVKSGVAAALTGAALMGAATSAGASTGAAYIGSGKPNGGAAVWCVQHNINYWLATSGSDAPTIAEDSTFGPATQAAIKEFQGEMGLTQDGTVGPRTGNAIMSHGDPYYTGSNMPNDASHQGNRSAYCYTYLPTTW